MTETWRAIPDYPGYLISDLGRIKSLLCIKGEAIILRGSRPKNGRHLISLWRDGVPRTFQISRLVCRIFHGEPPTPKHQAAHEDGNPRNNAASNLSWKTGIENAADKVRHGTVMFGSRNPAARLTADQAVAMRIAYRAHKAAVGHARHFVAALAAEHKVPLSCVEGAIYMRTWTHVALGSEIMAGHFGPCEIGMIQ